MSKSIKLKDNNYLDSSSIVHGRRKLNDILFGQKADNGWVVEQTVTVTTNSVVSILVLYHYAHGSCGGIYVLFRGTSTGNRLETIISSIHATVEYTDNEIRITADSWGVGYYLIELV